jgi:hypothetical protein
VSDFTSFEPFEPFEPFESFESFESFEMCDSVQTSEAFDGAQMAFPRLAPARPNDRVPRKNAR